MARSRTIPFVASPAALHLIANCAAICAPRLSAKEDSVMPSENPDPTVAGSPGKIVQRMLESRVLLNSFSTTWSALFLQVLLAGAICVSGCTSITRYRSEISDAQTTTICSSGSGKDGCDVQSTEHHPNFTLHVVEFDDEGWPFDERPSDAQAQLDSAILQVRNVLADQKRCVRLFVYVHGWQHNASGKDDDVKHFREFLDSVAKRGGSKSDTSTSACAAPIQVNSAKESSANNAATGSEEASVVGLFVGWRGLSLEGDPLKYTSFWDRKNTAERVAQGSVRELFGRLSAVVDANRPSPTGDEKPLSRLRVYVIGHSFGASIVFRALSQTLIESFAAGLDDTTLTAAPSISRSFDMVVLVNPAIEAARFDPLFRAASKRAALCQQRSDCVQPPYQAPVLAIFTSEGDWATKLAFPVGAALGNIFEKATTPEQARAVHKTIGWDDDYVTHELKPDSCTSEGDRDPFEGPPEKRRYRQPGWTWCFADDKTGPLALTQMPSMPGKTAATTTYNGPLWNVRVSPEIIANHDDIWNDKFRGVLLHFFADSSYYPIAVETSATSASH